MIFQHHRAQIWNQSQHPYKHSLTEFLYVNPALPGVTNIESALNYILAVLYPQTQPAVATTGDLPLVGNTLNDYRVVLDDGDGKAASYRWEQREGDVSPKWYKVMDMDWSTDSILAAYLDVTQDLYVVQKGKEDLDENGDPITGIFAGQRVWGGTQTNQNLTLDANSADGTGYVQSNNTFRPTVNNSYDIGTASENFRTGYFATSLLVADFTIATGSITNSSGSISFGDEDLSTTGSISGAVINSSAYANMAEIATPGVAPAAGFNYLYFKSDDKLYRQDSAGSEFLVGLNFTSSNDNRLVRSDGTGGDAIQESGVSLDDSDNMTGLLSLSVGSLSLSTNTITSLGVNQDISLTPNGTGKVVVPNLRISALTNDVLIVGRTDGTITATGVSLSALNELSGVNRLDVDNLRLDGNAITSTDINGDISLAPNGTGVISVSADIVPNADNTLDLGNGTNAFQDLHLKGSITDNTDSIAVSTLMGLRYSLYRDIAQTQPAQAGDALFFDAVNSVWLASAPDSEIVHGNLTGLGLDDHTQYALLAGRTGGQTLIGGVNAGDNLDLESTSNATKGSIRVLDNLIPATDASFSGSWSGTDLGDSTHHYNDVYTKGEFVGFRFENFLSTGLPSSSAQNVGRAIYTTDTKKILVDDGTAFRVAGIGKYLNDEAFDGVQTVKNVDVSSQIQDARNAIIQLLDNSNDFERIVASITATSASNVRITTNVPLPAGSYRLIVME